MAYETITNQTAIDALAATDVAAFDDASDLSTDPAFLNRPKTKKVTASQIDAFVKANGVAVNPQTGTSYTVLSTDNGKLLTFSNASAITVTLPQQSTTTTSAGFVLWYINLGAGTVTFVKEGAETLTGNTTAATNASGKIDRNTATNWNNFGGTATVADQECFEIDLVTNNVYNIILKAKFAGTITSFAQSSTSLGTAGNYTIKINSTAVTGLSAITNTTAITDTSATALNTFVIGDAISVTFASTVALTNFCGQLSFTRTY